MAFLAFPVLAFGAVQIVKEVKSYEYISQVQMLNGKSLQLYKLEDSSEPSVKCYVLASDVYSPSVSCVSVVNSVVKK